MNIAEQARHVTELKRKSAEADAAAKDIKQAYQSAERRFYEALEQTGVGSIKVDGVLHVPVQTIYGTVQDKEAFAKWADENAPEMLEPKPRAQLINEMVREYLETGQELPEGLGFYVKEYVSARIS